MISLTHRPSAIFSFAARILVSGISEPKTYRKYQNGRKYIKKNLHHWRESSEYPFGVLQYDYPNKSYQLAWQAKKVQNFLDYSFRSNPRTRIMLNPTKDA
jgi:hypothetical protein